MPQVYLSKEEQERIAKLCRDAPVTPEDRFYLGVWFATWGDRDFFMIWYRDPGELEFHGTARFRLHHPDSTNPFDGMDQKSSFSFDGKCLPTTEEGALKEAREAFNFVKQTGLDFLKPIKDCEEVLIRGTHLAMLDALRKCDWAHVTVIPAKKEPSDDEHRGVADTT